VTNFDYGEKFYNRMILLCLIVIAGVVIVGTLTAPGPITTEVNPASWQVVPKQSGNPGWWLVLGPAGIPYAFGTPERCVVAFEIDSVELRSAVDRTLCDTRPEKLAVTYRQPDGPGSRRIFLDEVRETGDS